MKTCQTRVSRKEKYCYYPLKLNYYFPENMTVISPSIHQMIINFHSVTIDIFKKKKAIAVNVTVVGNMPFTLAKAKMKLFHYTRRLRKSLYIYTDECYTIIIFCF